MSSSDHPRTAPDPPADAAPERGAVVAPPGSESSHPTLFGTDRRVVALGVARMADAMGNSFIIVVLPLYIASGGVSGEFLGFSESLITGIVLGTFGLVSSILQPLAGRLSDRAGRRKLFVVLGLAVFTVANFSFTVAHDYWLLLVLRAVQGAGAALTITASLALISELSRKDSRGGNMGVYNSFRLIGFGAGPLISGALVEAGPYPFPWVGRIDGFTAAFVVAAAAALFSAVFVGVAVQDPDETEPSTERLVLRILGREPGQVVDPIFALGMTTFIMSLGFALIAAIEPVVNRRLDQGAFLFSIQFSALIAAVAVLQPFVGRASDEYGRKRFIVAGMICLVPTTFVQGMVTAPWHLIAARAAQGVSAAMVFAPALALAGDLADEGQVAAQLSVLTVAFGLGVSCGSILSGYAIRFGFLAPFALGAGLAFLGALLVMSQVHDPRRSPG